MEVMRCGIWLGDDHFDVQERPKPVTGPGQVRVRIEACGVCLTEVHSIQGAFGPSAPPRLMGHEFGGLVDELGPEVTSVAVGTPVACAGAGGFAEYVVVPAERVFPIPAGVPLEEAALVEPILCCSTATQNANLPMGADILITGAGPMGLIQLQLVRRGGAARVIVSEPRANRRALASELGADEVIDPTNADVAARVREITGGRGVDAAFETAGDPRPLADCVAAATQGGAIVLVGVNDRAARFEVQLHDFHFRDLRLIGSYGGAGRGGFRAAVGWLGQIQLQPLISHRFGLAQLGDAFAAARTGAGCKVLVYPGAQSLGAPRRISTDGAATPVTAS
jgi:threonine dehydrogenase-like Zn-dependent dehydrogenase